MTATIYNSREIYTESGPVDGYLVAQSGKIQTIAAGAVPTALGHLPTVDATGYRIIPGMIDVHIHGAGGWPVEGATPAALRGMARYLAAHGTTGFLATTSARALPELEQVVSTVREVMKEPVTGARLLGTHLEGPMLNPAKKGAMDPALFRQPSVDEVERLLELGAGTIRRVTLAPELPGAAAVIRFLVSRGVAVAGGHTDATYEETRAGIAAGVLIANHTYNAMTGLHHREPGALSAYMLDDRVLCEVIADFLHVHPAAIAVLLRVAGADRIALISDAIPAAGMPPGRYQLFGRDCYIDSEGFSKLENGTIAGSTKLVLAGLRNLIDGLGVSWTEACRMAALVPARTLGLAEYKGSLAPGKDADLVLVDQHWQVVRTVVEGQTMYQAGRVRPELNPDFLAARKER